MNLMEFIDENPRKQKNKKRPATQKQVSFATAIADALGLEYPNFEDISGTSAFISKNKDAYYDEGLEVMYDLYAND